MGKRKREKSSHKKRSSSTHRTPSSSSASSSSSSEDDLKHQVKFLKKEIRQLKRKPAISTQAGDECLIPIYDPSKDDTQVENWVHRVDNLAERYQWSDDTIVRLIASRLRGNARQWYDEQVKYDASWKDIRSDFVAQFRKSVPFSKLLKDAANYETAPDQNLGDYCFKKLSKLRALHLQIPEDCLVDAVIGGITDENIARTVRSARQCDANSLYAYLNTMGNMPTSSRNWENKPNTIKKRDYVQVNKPHRSNNDIMTCYNCGISGHFARNCRRPRRECTFCKKLGHTKDKCQFSNKFDKFSGQINLIEKIREPSNIFVKTAYVNGRGVKCLIDTGSSHTLIQNAVVEKFNINTLRTKELTLRSFLDSTILTNIKAPLNVRVMEARAYINAIVVPDLHMKYPLLIGRDFLDLPSIVMIKSKHHVILRSLITSADVTVNAVDVVNNNVAEILEVTDINFGNLRHKDKLKVVQLLNAFFDRISTTLKNLGKTDTMEIHIKTKSDEPVVCHPYRMPQMEKNVLKKIINELLDNAIIRESQSSYASPVMLVKKKNGDYRMCVDYRKLNALTVQNRYPLPLIEEQIDRLGGNTYFTTLDLASGYYQVPVAEASVEKTAFITPEGHYEFLRMPFGLTNAPSVFQKLIDNVLGDLKNTIAFPYIDDIIIPSVSVKQGIERLKQVLLKFRQHNLTLKLSKCFFFKTQVEYLGREISAEGVRPSKRKVEAVLKMPHPRTIKEVRQFLGLAGYFRKFIQNFATIVEPLTRLLRKNTVWSWEQPQITACARIQQLLTSNPILTIFNPERRTELHTDASSVGIGAVLLQFDVDGVGHVISYFSKQNSTDQRHYHSYELETMAAVLSMRHFRVYLLGITFKLVTDCNALRTTLSKKDLLPRIGRWWIEIQEYTFEIEYRAGSKMSHVDFLSRNPIGPLEVKVNVIDLTEGDWIVAAQLEDEQLRRIRSILETKTRTAETKQYFKNYEVRHNKLFRKLSDNHRAWVVPRSARMQICRLCHDDAGHLGVDKTIKRIRTNYWFAGLTRFVTKYVHACLHCAYYKKTGMVHQGKLHPISKTPVPFHTIHIDHMGPFETSKKKNKFLFVVVDAFTKFCIIEPVRDQKTKHVVKILLSIMYLFGAPSRIISDRGTAFTSSQFKIFAETYNIKHILNAVATPRSNGQVERYNKTILAALAPTMAGKHSDAWDTCIKPIQSALNTCHNKAIGTTPTEALLGYKSNSVTEAWLLNVIQNELQRVDLHDLRSQITAHITADQAQQKKRYDEKSREAPTYAVGDLVMVLITSEPATGSSRKLFPKFKGPFRVTKRLLNDRYAVVDLREGAPKRSTPTVVAADNIKKWLTIQDDER